MKLRFFAALLPACLILAFSCNSRAESCSACSAPPLRSASPLGEGGIENLYDQQQTNVSPFNADLRLGGLYDSRVGVGSNPAEAETRTGLWPRRWRRGGRPPEGNVGVRLDYRGYMDFHQDFLEYNLN